MPDRMLELCRAYGYEVRFRAGDWVECLLVRGDESWFGRGLGEALALRAALKSACPSALAWSLFEQALEATPPSAEPKPIASSEPPPASSDRWPVPLVRTRSSIPPLVPKIVPPTPDYTRSLEELRYLQERIRASKEELGLSSPERQRLAILAWICEARAHTEPFPENTRIRDDVAAISRQLTELGKAFWPGSVTALQLQMQPTDLPRYLLGGTASTWSRAAELSERALNELEQLDERRGHDHYGWADRPFLYPPPADPEAALRELSEEIEDRSGPLDRQATSRSPFRPDAATFQMWTRRLRWLRGVAYIDPDLWARLAGRLRWWAGRRDPALAGVVRELDSTFAPDHTWAQVLEMEHADDRETALAPSEELVSQARSTVKGKRIVLVSTRRDPDLMSELSNLLEGAELDWRVAEARRLEELGGDLESGTYDMVLGALGLQAKDADLLLARAAEKSKVDYVRVQNGRPIVCVRRLATWRLV